MYISRTFSGLVTGRTYCITVTGGGHSGSDCATTFIATPPTPTLALTVDFAAVAYTATEGGNAAQVSITLDQPSDRDLVVPLVTTPASGHFSAPPSVSFSPGDDAATAVVTATADDNLDDETVVLSFGTLPNRVSAGTQATTTVTLTDAGISVSFGAPAYVATEGGSVQVSITLDQPSDRDFVIPLVTTPASGNFTAPPSVSFSTGDTTTAVAVAATDDDNFDNEIVVLSFGALPAPLSPGTLTSATVHLLDAGRAPLAISFAAGGYTATERGADAVVSIGLDQPADRPLAIPLITDPTTGPFTAPPSAHFPIGATSATAIVAATADANLDNETVVLSFGPLPPGVSAGSQATTTVTILDAGPTELGIDVSAITVEEGATADLHVSLSRPFPETVTFQWSTADATATAGSDYTPFAATPVSFAPGETAKTLSVPTHDDSTVEPDETFGVSLTAALPIGVSLGTALATITIEDNDSGLTLRIREERFTAVEGGPPVHIEFELDPPADRPVSIPLVTVPLRGLTSIDHPPLPDAVSFEPDQDRATATVLALSDNDDDPGEALLVSLGALPADVTVDGPETVLIAFQQAGPRETLASSLPVLLAAVARSISATGQAAVETRLSRRRQRRANHARGRRYDAGASPYLFAPPADPTAPERDPAASAALQHPFFFEDPGGLALWGGATLTQFTGHPAASSVDYEGRLWSAHLGLDLFSSPAGLVGLAFSRDATDVDYTAAHYTGGTLTARMHSVRPYAYWQAGRRVGVWATVAGGTGRVSSTLDDTDVQNARIRFDSFSAGSDTLLFRRNGTQLRIRADAFASQLTATGSDLPAQVRGRASQARLLLDWARDTALPRGRELRLQLQSGARYDRGDADRGLGAESTARIAFLDPRAGFDVALFAHTLLAHRDGHRDSGFGLQASWDPGSAGLGWRVAVTAGRGEDAPGRTFGWEDPTSLTTAAYSGAHLDGELAYGIPLAQDVARLTWYTVITPLPPRHALRTGATVHILPRSPGGTPIRCELSAARVHGIHGIYRIPDHALSLRVSLPF